MEDVLLQETNGVAWITLNRPDAGNALTYAMRDQMTAWLNELSASYTARVVVITGTGEKGFCTGADLRAPRPAPPPRPEGAPDRVMGDAARMIQTGWQRLVGAVLDCEKPVIAGINATVAGGGCHLAMACDLVIMAEEARFIEVFVRRGIIPDAGGCYLLPRLIGPQKAKELMFFGDDVSAADAERIGLVNKVVPRADLEKSLTEWAERLATLPTKSIGMTKALVNRSFESSRPIAFAEEAWAQELVNATDDAREGMLSFAERRAPDFKGW
ncbi:MAG TPA: enoyl-CoA hydratase/isomerase family protein [Acidimicrobiales bacterium]|nr:enoyl-CoA hydratase/isomerase family protein [Acidimicrobiales bacterium]